MRYFIAKARYLGYSSREAYVLDHSEGDFQIFSLIVEVPESFASGREGRPLLESDLEELKEKCPEAYQKVKSEKGPLFIVPVP